MVCGNFGAPPNPPFLFVEMMLEMGGRKLAKPFPNPHPRFPQPEVPPREPPRSNFSPVSLQMRGIGLPNFRHPPEQLQEAVFRKVGAPQKTVSRPPSATRTLASLRRPSEPEEPSYKLHRHPAALSRSTFMHTKSAFSTLATSASSNDSCAMTWHQWQVEYPTDKKHGST
jgi:hypothetical protein